ncbi:DNA methyltransferase dim-2 [Grosmannia clavigera kw1407]|uniref:DNA (cytosine-5-)-methyltransferase n=1 Tax=Grosmannia clavigera (strain kw1407 / UAMH 11150) TaxID=655863 RepID=F0XN91_GROCL|nr:DNA methyltransferase dim-2 [Grosmannia clavigera kw1407]EFX00790.1 DNA methyltransferase dim-2 [Grosmannia clavigera kw1407]
MREGARALSVQLPESTVTSPRSVAVNYEPRLAVTVETTAVDELLATARLRCIDKDYVELELDEFEIYRDPDKTQARLVSLHHLGTDERLSPRLYFDGILSVGGSSRQFYVQRVPVVEVPVDNYGADCDTAAESVWLRSEVGRTRNVFYRLGRPSVVYKRFFRPFLWIVDLGKHFVDFCEHLTSDGRGVRLSHFKTAFARWLRRVHGQSTACRRWHAQFGRDDFRTAVTAHREYLWKEVSSILGEERGRSIGFFREVSCQLYHNWTPDLDRQPVQPTVVTPYNYRLFSHLAIGPYLQETPGKGVARCGDATSILPQCQTSFRTGPEAADKQAALRAIQVGDVISCLRDSTASGSGWSAEGERSPFWYALVHRVTSSSPTGRRLDVAWLYAPEHTPCRQMRYPWRNELFLSDHCTCDEDVFLAEHDVVAVHSVDWFGRPDTTADFFVRQTYLCADRCFVRLQAEHTVCKSSPMLALFADLVDAGSNRYAGAARPLAVGDTVLATLAAHDVRSEPFAIVALFADDNSIKGEPVPMARLRRLLRRRAVDATAPAAADNELVYSQQIVSLPASRIVGRCVVRVFPADSSIPSPYNRGGAGNLFFMTHKECLVSNTQCAASATAPATSNTTSSPTYIPLQEPVSLRQGFHPTPTCQRKLRALDLFCGCGSLGRGLEDAGVVETRWANDIWDRAIHTLMANRATADAVEPFLGSADELLARALQGRYSRAVPAPGEVDLISGGSPCQGFSVLTSDKAAPKQYKNRSMVASFASMVDLYRPLYGVLENVPAFVARQPRQQDKNHREDIFGQLLCALVGLGYQVAVHLGNAWAYGAPQSRQRVFLLFAAPAVRLPVFPLPSHGSPSDFHATTAVGGLANGDCIAEAWDGPTAFPFVSIGRATADLQIGPAACVDDGFVDVCIPHPDHRVCADTSDQMRLQIAYVPPFPFGMNVPRAMARRHEDPATSPSLRVLFTDHVLAAKMTTNAYKRVDPTRLLATVTTNCNAADGWTGAVLHWRHRRPLTVLEVRRAQGMPDDDVLVGSPKDQWKMVGNAVARPLAMAIGLAVREAWLGSLDEDPRPPSSCRPSPKNRQTPLTTVTATSSASSPFKQNRIFKTSVRRSTVSGATVVSLADTADSDLDEDRPHKRPPPVVIDLTAKRPRYDSDSEATMVGDESS